MPAQHHSGIIEDLCYGRNSVLSIAARSGPYRRFPDGRSERYTTADGLANDPCHGRSRGPIRDGLGGNVERPMPRLTQAQVAYNIP